MGESFSKNLCQCEKDHSWLLYTLKRCFCLSPPPSQQMFVKGSLEVNGTQQQHPNNVYHDLSITRNKIVTAQFECYQKIMKDNRESREGSVILSILQYGKTPDVLILDTVFFYFNNQAPLPPRAHVQSDLGWLVVLGRHQSGHHLRAALPGLLP